MNGFVFKSIQPTSFLISQTLFSSPYSGDAVVHIRQVHGSPSLYAMGVSQPKSEPFFGMELKPKTKLRAMGYKKVSDIDPMILNSKSIDLFPEPHPNNIRKVDGAQYFSDFLDYLQTGSRAATWKEPQCLAFIEIKTPKSCAELDFRLFQAAFAAFFTGLTVEVLPEKLQLVKRKGGGYFLENKAANISQALRVFENADGEPINLSSSDIIRAQRALLKYVTGSKKISSEDAAALKGLPYYFSSVSFINHPIIIECSPQDIITGRAQGFDGAVISLSGCVQREILTTALHECMHVFSLDHCFWWDCIMNFSYEFSANYKSGGSIHLCPSCLVKLQHQLGFDVLARYAKLYQFYKNDAKYLDDAKFIESIIRTFSKIPKREEKEE